MMLCFWTSTEKYAEGLAQAIDSFVRFFALGIGDGVLTMGLFQIPTLKWLTNVEIVQIYLWVGKDARAEEKKAAADLAVKYLEQASKTTGRDPDVPVTEIKSGKEPPMFTCHFLGWDDTRNADFVDPYKEKLKKLKSEQGNVSFRDAPRKLSLLCSCISGGHLVVILSRFTLSDST